ncbi:MAG TPA: AbrB/MazE/SpoVT family DNA-binding domain-containing protein [Vicinamibacteria bacterium]|nr:AbrB/MazE/SpoVT family DNA-binding domain-containing protein [Vicinamibacteria bacterium]
MRTTIDRAGRLVVPKALRRAARLLPGSEVEVRLAQGGRIEIEPVPAPVRLEKRGGLLVAVLRERSETLTLEEVNAVTAALREPGADSDGE